MKKVFNERHLKAIELLANGNLTYNEVADAVGVTSFALREWRKDPEFQEQVRKECRDLLKESEPSLYQIALQQAHKTGSAQHLKLLLERIERLEDIADGRGPAYDVMFTWKKKDDAQDESL